MLETSRKILSDITIYSKYAKYIPHFRKRETWEEIVLRNMDMHIKKFPHLEDEIRQAYMYVLDKKVLPSMRSIQFAGKPIELSPNRLFNCYEKSTKFITQTGVKSFEDFNDGDEVIVPSHTGEMREAVVRSYGKQKFNHVILRRGQVKKSIKVTPNHRWLLRDGKETTDLKEGDVILGSPKIFSNFLWEEADPFEKLYWCYGYVYGDGTRNGDYSMVRLCGYDKNKFLHRFKELGFKTSEPLSCKGDAFAFTGSYQKIAPDPEIDDPRLIKAFVVGYLDADGGKNPDWYQNNELSPYSSIQSSEKDHIEFIEKCFESVGFYITSEKDITGQKTNYGTRPFTKKYILSTKIGTTNAGNHWVVDSIFQTNEEDIAWCLEVEKDHSFILSGGIVTGNCSYLACDSVEVFSETMFLLLGGSGVGYSVQKHHIEKLPEIIGPKKRKRRYLISDSIEGWADAVKVLVESYFHNKMEPVFDFRDIRPKGAALVTSGGKAPGPQPLKDCLHNIRKVFDNAKEERGVGTQLTTLEVHDTMCYIADAVLAGGIRRAALISLFSFDDESMLSCKSGNWWELNPQRARANNSAVALRNKIKEKTFKKFWERVKASGCGEPGIFFTNDKDYGTNPSLRAGTKVLTKNGIFPIDTLEDKKFIVPNLDGKWSEAKCWKSGEDIPLYKLVFDDGSEYFSSPQHEWPVFVNGRYVKCSSDKLKAGDLMPINEFKRDELFEGTLGTYDIGLAIGWLYGDGCLTKRSDTGKYVASYVFSKKEEHIANKLLSIIKSIDGVDRKLVYRKSSIEFQVGSEEFISYIMDTFKVKQKRFGLPANLWTDWKDETIRGFIDGLFSSDGHVPIDNHGISLTSSHSALANDVRDLLGFYGIKGKIYHKLIKSPTFPNGKVYNKTYDSYIYRTNLGGRYKFKQLFNLSSEDKQLRLNSFYKGHRLNNINNKHMILKSVELTTKREDVWDISVKDHTHCFHLPTVTTGNCCEISLRSMQFCNLTTVNVGDIESQDDLNSRVKAAAFIGTLQASYTDFHYLREKWRKNTEKEALLGVSMTGIGSGNILKYDLEIASNIAVEENKRVSKIIGINKAARVTCIKPEGTASCVVGSSSGIHAWHSQYFIRRMRLGKNEPIYNYLNNVIPELLEDEVFRPNDQTVLSLPIKAPEDAILRSESAIDLLEREKLFYEKWVCPGHSNGQNTHNVSVTVSIKDDEWEKVGNWMWENRNSYNGISVLPYDGGTYTQAPFSDCTKEEYEILLKKVKDIDLSKITEEDDFTKLKENVACAGGICTVTHI